MLLYIQSKAYPGRTFVDLCRPSDTVARVRANLLHSLHEIGHSNHQFRLQYKGSYLRDAYTLEEYKILNNAVISMIPLNDVSEWNKDLRFHQSTTTTTTTDDQVVNVVQSALCEEIGYLDTREKVLRNYKTLVMMQIVLAFLALFTVYWYFFFAYLFVIFASFIYSPSFTRIGGWMGKNSVRRREFMVVMILLCTLMVASSILLLVFSVSELTLSPYPTTRCQSRVSNCFSEARGDPVEEGVCTAYQMRCYESSVWTSVYFCIVIIFMISTGILCCYLLYNFKFEVGDFIEHYLIQTREMQQVMHAAKHGDTSQKRSAVFELATMAASADDNKFQIVTEGGLDILISLALSKDSTTQEYAAEATAECLTVPAIQDQFVATGGMKTLTALLYTKNPRTVREAITAISYVVSDSDENKMAVVADHGLEDLSYASKYADHRNRRVLSTIFLELAYYSETRASLLTRSTPTEAIVNLLLRSSSPNEDYMEDNLQTTILALQALELLAIETPTLITTQENLLEYLLVLPSRINENKIQLLASQLLLNWTHSPEDCEKLCSVEDLTDNLLYFVHSNDANIIRVIATIALRITEPISLRSKLNDEDFQDFILYLQNASSDRQTWNLTAQALDNLQNKPDSGFIQKNPVRPTSSSSSEGETFTQ